MGADATAADRRRGRDRMGRADHADPDHAPEAQVRGMLFWLIGDLSGATRGGPGLLALAGVLVVAMFFARDATLLSRGDATAASLGVSVRGTSLALHALAAFATAVAVTSGRQRRLRRSRRAARGAPGHRQRPALADACRGARGRRAAHVGRHRRAHAGRPGAASGRRAHGASSACHCSCGFCARTAR